MRARVPMPMSTSTAFRNRIEPRFMNRPRLVSRRGIPYHGDLSFVNISLSCYRMSTDAPWWECHQAGGVLGQGGSEGESAVGSKLALTRAPTLCRRGHPCLDGVEMATPYDVAGARRRPADVPTPAGPTPRQPDQASVAQPPSDDQL